MPNVNGNGTTWNLPNYAGELFTADVTKTPLLSMIGGLTGGKITSNFEFPTGSLFANPDPKQPEISEDASVTAPTALNIVRTQETNVTQIHHETLDVTYVKESNAGRMSGLNTAGQANNAPNELSFQTARRVEKIARDVEQSFISGVFQKSTSSAVASKTRGMLELTSTGTTIAAGGSPLSFDILQTIYREMVTNGAEFRNVVLFVNAYQKQMISKIYSNLYGANLPSTRAVGGVNIQNIVTDFADVGVVYSPYVPVDTVLLADVSYIAPVFQPVPDKGVLFMEELAIVGASKRYQIFGQVGLDHGPAFLHGSITGLASA